MKIIKNQEFGGERPLYCEKDLQLEEVIIHAGESSLKETANITALRCRFEGKYPFWCCNHFVIRDCIFTVGARAALWYSRDVEMTDTIIDAPKMFREMEGIKLRDVQIPGASETFWHCGGVDIDNVVAERADYIFMHCHDMVIRNFNLSGNYSFQWTRDVEIHNSILNTKDAFWETDNVRVYDSNSSDGTPAACILSAATSPAASPCATLKALCWKTAPSETTPTSPSNIQTSRPRSRATFSR